MRLDDGHDAKVILMIVEGGLSHCVGVINASKLLMIGVVDWQVMLKESLESESPSRLKEEEFSLFSCIENNTFLSFRLSQTGNQSSRLIHLKKASDGDRLMSIFRFDFRPHSGRCRMIRYFPPKKTLLLSPAER